MSETTKQPVRSTQSTPHPVLRIVLPLIILGAGIGLAVVLVKTKAPPRKRPADERAAIVEVQALARTNCPVVIEAAGTVVPRDEVPLQARVSGEIVSIDPRFVPGGRFAAGETILELDPTDYRLEATNSYAALVRAEANLAIERGLQDVARHEWETMQKLDTDPRYTEEDEQLALRGPELRLAASAVWSARAAFQRALLNLDRTRVKAPFNTVIRQRDVNVGAQVGSQTTLAQLAGTDAYWIQVTLPADQVKWIALPDASTAAPGARATIHAVAGAEPSTTWEGRVIQKLPDLERQGRQAQFIVEVPHPETPSQGRGDLPMGAYVQVRIDGPVVDNVFSIPRSALRDGHDVWLMNGEDRLAIREVTPIWSDRTQALVRDGLSDGEHLVITDISIPLVGMPLKTLADIAAETTRTEDKPAGQGARDE